MASPSGNPAESWDSFEHGIGFLDPDVATITIVADPIGDVEAKFNDGKCDCMGRFWTGSMSNDWVTPVGCLFRFDTDSTVRTMDSGFNLSNGMGWSPDNATMYFTDFGQSTIFAYDYDAQTGDIANRRPFVVIPEDEGRPDGMTVDADGCLWVALWDGWAVVQFNPAGKCIDRIPMPVKRPTSCMFGGPDLSIMYVTSAHHDADRCRACRSASGWRPLRRGNRRPGSRRTCVQGMIRMPAQGWHVECVP